MRIVFFTDTFAPVINGVVGTIILFANELTLRGHQVLIIAPDHGEIDRNDWGLDERVEVFKTSSVDGKVYPNFRIGIPTPKLFKVVRTFSPDVIHSFSPFVLGLQGLVVARRLHIPIVCSHLTNFTDEQSLKALKLFPRTFLEQAQKSVGPLLRWYLNMHDGVHVPSKDTQTDIENMGVTKPIQVIHSPIDVHLLQSGREKGRLLRSNLGIKRALIFAGRLSGEKNIDVSLSVFAKAVQEFPDLHFVLIGDGPERNALWEQAARLRVLDRIVWMGAIPYKTLVQNGYYFLGDVFLTLSEFETQGMSTVEALACGLDVVGANARGTKEVLGTVGHCVEVNDTAVIINEVSKALNVSSASEEQRRVKKAEEYDITPCCDALLQLYERFCE